MSLDEIDSTWSAQRTPSPTTEARTWIEKSNRAFRFHTVLMLVGVLGTGTSAALQIHRLITDPVRTLGNSTVELMVPLLTFFICLGGAVLLRRSLLKYRSLMHHTRQCLQLILHEKQREIIALTRWLPVFYMGFFVLIVLGKLQSIAAEFESPANAWSGVWLTAVLLVVVSAFLYHRAQTFLKPEITELKRTLDSLVTG